MDIEWAKDGQTGQLFIVQARPETIHSAEKKTSYEQYILKGTGKTILTGTAVGTKVASGAVRIIKDVKNINEFKAGEILVTEITDPDWEPIMKIAAAIITDKGGRTSHAAIVSRELGIPAVVGTELATKMLKNGQQITIDCSSGKNGIIYEGVIPFEIEKHEIENLSETKTHIMVNIGAPDEAFKNYRLPVKGVGLGRLEFIISSHIQIHPNALLEYQKLKSQITDSQKRAIVETIEKRTIGYEDKKQYYVDELAEGIAKIASTFYPYPVIIRFSDFKTNEYRTLVGGNLYEPEEENPMIGFRGASRYYHPKFKEAFLLECASIKKARDVMGLKNIIPMIPFCRTLDEGKEVVSTMQQAGLDRVKDDSLKIYVMCEIPSNVVLADKFLDIFDGMSIGSNDLAQLTLGLDRDSDIVNKVANENNDAVKKLIKQAVDACKKRGKYVGICGQAPSDFPEFAAFLVDLGIESISLTPDTVIKTLEMVAQREKTTHASS